MSKQRIAILGAGPIGIETALKAIEAGFEADVYERKRPGAHVARWGHVQFFSPWKMNRSPWGEQILRQQGRQIDEPEAFPTGSEYLQRYLLPLAQLDALRERIHLGERVVGVSRREVFKGEFIGDPARADSPFAILLDGDDGERYVEADIVVDTTGVYDEPRRLGPGGLPALGERHVEERIERYIPDVLGDDRTEYADKATLLVGSGYSAVTTAHLLARLHKDAPATRLIWLLLADQPPYELISDDPLPQRLELARFGNRAARGEVAGVEIAVGRLEAISADDERLTVQIARDPGGETIEVDRLVANVGYKPDVELWRELQIHQCYASEGIMSLAAYLLSQSSEAGGDCLEQSSGGFDTLTSPEPDFYVLGAKSYGRNSDFLLRLGFEQIDMLLEQLRD